MNVVTSSIARLCLVFAALGIAGGVALLSISFLITPAAVLAFRSTALPWLGAYLFAVGAGYVFVAHQAPEQARLSGTRVNVFANLPPSVRPVAFAACLTAFLAFFAAIGLVESGVIERGVGEVAILGSFLVGAFSGIGSGAWSALRVGAIRDV